MDQEEEIIVFRGFENSIDANIVKTKLDAYGVPCFLTEENLGNLYPGQNSLIFTIRLHLFAKDKERAQQILEEGNLVVDNEPATACPMCHSCKIERDLPKKMKPELSSIINFFLFGLVFPNQKVYRCQECEYEFDMP